MRAPAQDRPARYMTRLERHIAELPEAKRALFVADQHEQWCERYAAWAARIDSGLATPIDLKCDAYDYIFTIMALSKKAQELAGEREEA